MKNYSQTGRIRSNVAITAEAGQAQQRSNQLGEAIVSPLRLDQYAAEGSMFTSANATMGTAVALIASAQTTFTATAPAFLIKNSDAVGGKDIILKRLSLTVMGAGTATTSLDCAVVVDSSNRYTSGGTTANIVNTRSDQSNASVAQIFQASAAIVSPAPNSTSRTVARRRLRSQIPVVSDQYILNFGSDSQSDYQVIGATTATTSLVNLAPIVIPPQSYALIYIWGAGMTGAPTIEWLMEHIER